jgi:hypothetical protein
MEDKVLMVYSLQVPLAVIYICWQSDFEEGFSLISVISSGQSSFLQCFILIYQYIQSPNGQHDITAFVLNGSCADDLAFGYIQSKHVISVVSYISKFVVQPWFPS